jgi:hypothetical protein
MEKLREEAGIDTEEFINDLQQEGQERQQQQQNKQQQRRQNKQRGNQNRDGDEEFDLSGHLE